MIAAILKAWLSDSAFSTTGNLNNHIGVPLTLLRLRQDEATWHRAGVVELGMNHPGEIAALAALTAPTVALVNNAQREHQEFMASVEAVAHENGAVIAALGASGVAVFPADDDHAADLAHARRPPPDADLRALGCSRCDVPRRVGPRPLGGAARNARRRGHAATAIGRLAQREERARRDRLRARRRCPLDAIRRGLEAFEPVKGRSQVKRLMRSGQAVTLIDDTYNANPDSVRAAIDVLAALPGPRWLVLGDMGEVGDQGPAFHREVGGYAKARGIETLWAVGEASVHAAQAFAGARHFATVTDAIAALAQAPACASMVVKGSRFMRTEQIVAALLAASDEAEHSAAGGPHAA